MLEVSPTTEVLARALDACALRHSVYSANLANAGVDGYRRLEVQFDAEAMRALVTGGMSADVPSTPPEIVTTQSAVKLDEEMAALAKNALQYQMLTRMYEGSLGTLRAAIHEGREA